jgi:hypothetical protein
MSNSNGERRFAEEERNERDYVCGLYEEVQ